MKTDAISHRHSVSGKQTTSWNHEHGLSAVDAALADLTARVTALEAAQPTPPTPAQTPTPAPADGRITAPGEYMVPDRIASVQVTADDVTLRGPGRIDRLFLVGVARFRLTNGVAFGMGTETPISVLWRADGTPCRDVVLEQFTVLHQGAPANGAGYSTFGVGGRDGPVPHERITIRSFDIDQADKGWGGIELWKTRDLVIEDGTFRGRGGNGAAISAHISIPRSDGAIIRRCSFDFRQGAFWGIELADVDDAVVEDCTAFGPDTHRRDGMAFLQLHPGSGTVLRATVRNNDIRDLWAFVNAHGQDHVITDNRLTNVTKPWAYDFTGPVTWERNA